MDDFYKNYVRSVKSGTSFLIEKPSFEVIQPLLFFYHQQLLKMAVKHISTDDLFAFEGGMASFNGTTNSTTEMVNKMKNIFYMAQECKGDVLEVGFNSGNSAIIFYLQIHIYIFMRMIYAVIHMSNHA